MVLVDTGVWIDHFNAGVPRLAELLTAGGVISHRWVLGEMLMGSGIPASLLRALAHLQNVPTLPDEILLDAIELYRWRGMSWVDLQLVLAANAAGHALWTRDGAARRAARDLGVKVLGG